MLLKKMPTNEGHVLRAPFFPFLDSSLFASKVIFQIQRNRTLVPPIKIELFNYQNKTVKLPNPTQPNLT